MLEELVQIGVKAETTEGTYNAPLVADAALLVRDPKYEIINPKMDRQVRSAAFSNWNSIGRQIGAQISFDMDLYAVDKTTKPKWDILFQACGLIATGGAGSPWVYGLVSAKASIPAVSISFNKDGYLRKIAGCRGAVKFKMVAGMPVVASFTFKGAHVAPTDTAFLAPTFDTTSKDLPAFVGAAVALTHVSPATDDLTTSEAVLETLEIDLGNEIFLSPSANSSTGFLSTTVVNRDPKIMIDPEMTSVSAFDWLSNLKNDYAFAFTTGVMSAQTALNTIKFDAPNLQFYEWTEENRGGIAVAKAGFRCRRSVADNDELTITLSS